MPINSYLVYPHSGQRNQLIKELSKKPCDIIPAENSDLLIMVSDTKDLAEEEEFISSLNNISSLDHYTLVSGFKD